MSIVTHLKSVSFVVAIPLILVWASLPSLIKRPTLPKPFYRWIFISVILALHQYTLFLSPRYVDPALAEVLSYLWPVIVVSCQGFLPKEKHYLRFSIPATLAFLSVIILQFNKLGGGAVVIYCLLPLAASGLWAAYVLISRHQKEDPPDRIGWYYVLAALFSSVPLIMKPEKFLSVSLSDHLYFAILGFFIIGLGIRLWERGVKGGNLRILSVASSATPTLSVALLIFLGYSAFSWNLLITLLLLAISLTLCAQMSSQIQKKQQL